MLLMENCSVIANLTGNEGSVGAGGALLLLSSGGPGAGIANDGTLTLLHATVTDNQTGTGVPPTAGGGIHNTGTLTLGNTIVSLNSAGADSDLSGEFSRLTTQAEQGDHLGFELEVRGGDGRDLLEFSIDGIVQASTSGAPIRVNTQLDGPGTHVLSWEFRRRGGDSCDRAGTLILPGDR